MFIIVAPMFVLAPLMILLLLSRPGSWREWLWIGLAVIAGLVWLRVPASFPEQTMRAAGLFYAGAFVGASLAGVQSLFNRSLIAAGFSAAGCVAWFARLGLRWTDLETAVWSQAWSMQRILTPGLPEELPTGGAGAVEGATRQLSDAVIATAGFFPAIVTLTAMAGGWVAWYWYHRIASRPIGRRAPRLVEFRFSDHLVWLVVIAGAVLLLTGPGTLRLVFQNLLLVLLAFHALRGLAVMVASLAPAPRLLKVLLAVLAVPLLHFAVIGLTMLGLADIWLDLRRRIVPPQGVKQ